MSSDRERAQRIVDIVGKDIEDSFPGETWPKVAAEFAAANAERDKRIATLESALGQVREWWLSAVNSEGRGSFDFYVEFHREFPLGDVNAALSGAGADHDERVRADEREACCKAACVYCANGEPATWNSDPRITSSGFWSHGTKTCHAAAIRERGMNITARDGHAGTRS